LNSTAVSVMIGATKNARTDGHGDETRPGMIRNLMILAATAALVGCGSGASRPHKSGAPSYARTATGPISRACMTSDRKARSRELCGCIQAVADQSLSASDQKLASSFYADPHRAQEIRQSDRTAHEAFWQRYKQYAETAAAVCN
jgi:hypothetical protein